MCQYPILNLALKNTPTILFTLYPICQTAKCQWLNQKLKCCIALTERTVF